jgi:hypothetical protein
MAGSQLKISADTGEAKKSILDLSRSLKNIGSSKVAIFTEQDRRFIKTELKKELTVMKSKLKENRDEIRKMVAEQGNLTKGSREELEVRRKILDAYKTQSKLGREMGELQSIKKKGVGGGGGGGILDKLMYGVASLGSMAGLGALAAGGFAIAKGIQGTNQYVGGTPNRVRLKGLGVNEDNFGSAGQLANAGLTEQDLIERRIQATSVLGRQGTNNQTELQKAMFERAYGLQGGTMTGVASQLRAGFGGAGANDAQVKLQASIMAAGIEDALGPYLETMTTLLSNINENGMTSTSDVTALMAQLTKEGERTPEQMGKTFQGINNAIMGSSGESNAFLQSAFARMGIGGGTIGGTKFALESGGLFGLDQNAMAKRGYNPQLLQNMGNMGMFSGMGQRSNAVLNMFKSQAGMGTGQSISGVTNPQQMIGLSNMANSLFGTKGAGGFDALKLLEKVQNKQMSPQAFNEQLKKMQETKDPQVERLEKINASLAGQTEILSNIDTNLAESLGKQGVVVRNTAKGIENQGTQGAIGLAGAVNDTGVVTGVGNAIQNGMSYLNSGSIGGKLYDWMHPGEAQPSVPPAATGNGAKEIGKEVANALSSMGITNNISIKNNPMSTRINEKTYK